MVILGVRQIYSGGNESGNAYKGNHYYYPIRKFSDGVSFVTVIDADQEHDSVVEISTINILQKVDI